MILFRNLFGVRFGIHNSWLVVICSGVWHWLSVVQVWYAPVAWDSGITKGLVSTKSGKADVLGRGTYCARWGEPVRWRYICIQPSARRQRFPSKAQVPLRWLCNKVRDMFPTKSRTCRGHKSWKSATQITSLNFMICVCDKSATLLGTCPGLCRGLCCWLFHAL